MQWFDAVDRIRPYMVKIRTPRGSGTGFVLAHSVNGEVCAVATAAHVVDEEHFWEHPIHLQSSAGDAAMLRHADRAIFIDAERDTAAVVFRSSTLALPENPSELITEGNFLRVGNEIGWLGYPAIPRADLCFFRGAVSAYQDELEAYFVDGVAINGVSGGPAFASLTDEPFIVGVVSAYMPNRATGETLPGLAIVRDVAQLHDIASRVRSLEEAQAEADEAAPEEPPTEPPTPHSDPATVPSSVRPIR